MYFSSSCRLQSPRTLPLLSSHTDTLESSQTAPHGSNIYAILVNRQGLSVAEKLTKAHNLLTKSDGEVQQLMVLHDFLVSIYTAFDDSVDLRTAIQRLISSKDEMIGLVDRVTRMLRSAWDKPGGGDPGASARSFLLLTRCRDGASKTDHALRGLNFWRIHGLYRKGGLSPPAPAQTRRRFHGRIRSRARREKGG